MALHHSCDHQSHSNIDFATVTHLDLELKPDFSKKTIFGTAVLSIKFLDTPLKSRTHFCPENPEIILDTLSLDIQSVHFRPKGNADKTWYPVSCWRHQPTHTHAVPMPFAGLGIPLCISLGVIPVCAPEIVAGTEVELKVVYSTVSGDDASAMQWMMLPERNDCGGLASGKMTPYLFTQCQAIKARSLVPCMDTPSVRASYKAVVRLSGADSEFSAVMSARCGEVEFNGELMLKSLHFEQPIAIPSYLIALAVGDIKGVRIGPRSTIYADPNVVDFAAREFEDIEKIIKAGEEIVMPYMWDTFDILVLPNSFPYGGMENPNMTFATPTLLAGDKSLVNVVVHEFAHSYSGNLVSASTWGDFWLNEGWTVFLERKILARLSSDAEAELQAISARWELEESILKGKVASSYTRLSIDMQGVDPDESFSIVPYEKGFNFLYMLEHGLGEKFFAGYIKANFKEFAHRSITTEQWRAFLEKYVAETGNDAQKKFITSGFDWKTWLFGLGCGPVHDNVFDSTLIIVPNDLLKIWVSDDVTKISSSDIQKSLQAWKTMSNSQRLYFLEKLQEKQAVINGLPYKVIEVFQKVHEETTKGNSEIRFRWLQLCLEACSKRKIAQNKSSSDQETGHALAVFQSVADFLRGGIVGQVGRMKYVRPLYRKLKDIDAAGLAFAKTLFAELRDGYHPVCQRMVSIDLVANLPEKK